MCERYESAELQRERDEKAEKERSMVMKNRG